MIVSFRHKALKRFFESDDKRGLNTEQINKIRIILTLLNLTKDLNDLTLPSFRLHPLIGELNGFYAVTVRANWRIIFKFDGENISDVDLIDYH